MQVLKPILNETGDTDLKNGDVSCKHRIKSFIRSLLEAGNLSALAKAVQASPEFSSLFKPAELEQLCGKSTSICVPAMLSSSSWDIPDLGPRR